MNLIMKDKERKVQRKDERKEVQKREDRRKDENQNLRVLKQKEKEDIDFEMEGLRVFKRNVVSVIHVGLKNQVEKD